jgi:hypothetical protein
MIGGSPIFFRSIKQKSQATSATHAEILAMYEAVTYITWVRQLLQDIGYPKLPPLKSKIINPLSRSTEKVTAIRTRLVT